MNKENEYDHIEALFQELFNGAPEIVVRAPGRVNLIGGHTDYNQGFVLPMAIDRTLWIGLRPRQDSQVMLHSSGFNQHVDFSLDDIPHGNGWADYIHGMAWALNELGYPLLGWEGVLYSNIPVASGLSSSAAIELAAARAFWAVSSWEWDGREMALAAKKMENEWLGLKSGIMDQMICACGKDGHALLIDCRDMSTELVPYQDEVALVVMDTSKPRGLVASPYNERVAQCAEAVKVLRIESLRDGSMEQVEAVRDTLDLGLYKRAKHIIRENDRVQRAVNLLRAGEIEQVGELINASHVSLRDDYEVSCVELDTIVEIAWDQPGCLGARMTGAGFGGCAIALVRKENVPAFIEKVKDRYDQETGLASKIYICQSAEGASLVE